MGRPRGQTQSRVVAAAFETLRKRGYRGATTRAVAEAGGFRPGLIFYYFDSLDDLLVAALAESSRERLDRYAAAVEDASSPAELLSVLRRIYEEDVASGHIRVVSELVGASVSNDDLREPVLELMQPWVELAERGVGRAIAGTPLEGVVPIREAALAAVTFYLGANLLTHLQGEFGDVTTVLQLGEQFAASLDATARATGSA
jgi:AcrR family transcriptional regulator